MLFRSAWPEVAIGALAPGGVVLWGEDAGTVSEPRRDWLLRVQRAELLRRQRLYGDPDPGSLAGLHLVVVDDGIATGLTARAALISLRRLGPASLSLAVPVVDHRVLEDLEPLADQLVVLAVVPHLEAVGVWFERFEQLEDATVLQLLAGSRSLNPAGGSRDVPHGG